MKNLLFFSLALFIGLIGCQKQEISDFPELSDVPFTTKLVKVDVTPLNILTPKNRNDVGARSIDFQESISEINESLAQYGLQIEKMELLSSDQAGNTVFFSDVGNKQLSSDYVPNDPRNGNGTDIPFVADGTELATASGLTPLETYTAITNAMGTWEEVTCSDGLSIPNFGVAPFDIGFVQFLVGFGGLNGYFPGIIAHSGVLPAAFFDAVSPGGGSSILGVTFTFVWNSDLDEDGRGDVAIKEIYYNDAFNWQDVVNAGSGVDLETVVLHEVGHGLSQGHFGKLTRTESNGKLHFAPRALMNAGYTGVNRVVEQTDNAGHCSNWANWPNS